MATKVVPTEQEAVQIQKDETQVKEDQIEEKCTRVLTERAAEEYHRRVEQYKFKQGRLMHLIYDSCHVLTRRDTDPELYAITSEYLTRDYNDFCAFHAEFCNYLENVRSAESLDK